MGNKVTAKSKKTKKLSEKEVRLLQSTSKLTVKEIKDLHKAFWSDFPTGKMTKRGFIKYYEKVKEEKDRTCILCNHVFAVFDKDHNGTIDFPEFLLAIAADSPGDLDSHLNYVFEMCDVSGDGKMDVDELTTFLTASLTLMDKIQQTGNLQPEKLATGVFNTLATSKGQKLTKEQFILGCKADTGLRKLFGGGN